MKYSQLLYFGIHINSVYHLMLSQKPLSGATVDWFFVLAKFRKAREQFNRKSDLLFSLNF